MGNLKSKSYEVQKEEDKMKIKGSVRSRKITEPQRVQLPDRMSKEINEARMGDASILGASLKMSQIEDTTKTVDETTVEEKYTELQEIENQNDHNIRNLKATETSKTEELLRGTSTNDEEKIEVVKEMEAKRNSESFKTETEVLTNQQKEEARISENELLMPLKMQAKDEKPYTVSQNGAPPEKHDHSLVEEGKSESETVQSVEEAKPPEHEDNVALYNNKNDEAQEEKQAEVEIHHPEPENQQNEARKVNVKFNFTKEGDLHNQSSEESPNNTENINKSDDAKEIEIIELNASKDDNKREESAIKEEPKVELETKTEKGEDQNEDDKEALAKVKEQAPNICNEVNDKTMSKKSNELIEREKEQEEDQNANQAEKDGDQAPEESKESSEIVCQKPEQVAANLETDLGTASRSMEEKGTKQEIETSETEDKSQLNEICEKKGYNNEEPELHTEHQNTTIEEKSQSNETFERSKSKEGEDDLQNTLTSQTTPEEHVQINEVCQRKLEINVCEINKEEKDGGELNRSSTNFASSEEKSQSNELGESKAEETDLLTEDKPDKPPKVNKETEESKSSTQQKLEAETDLKEQTGNHVGIAPEVNPTASGPGWNLIKIQNIEKEVKEMKVRILHFSGTSPDREYLTLHEMLIRNIIDLDDISVEANEEIRNERKRVIKFTQQCLSDLERKIENPNTEKSGESDSE